MASPRFADMHYLLRFFICLTLAFPVLTFGQNPKAENLSYQWEDIFSTDEKEKITTWLNGVYSAVASTLGTYPFTVTLYIHRTKSHEPVPWAHTSRTGEQAVHFHVDPSFSLQAFKSDWTAPHELSHLSIPFVGRENMWFSEGYASFWQWQILKEQGVFSQDEIDQKLKTKMEYVLPFYQSDELFLDVSRQLKKQHNYPAVYWGGACFFLQIDAALRDKHKTSLQKVIAKFQQNGRLETANLNDLILKLDQISGTVEFSRLYQTFTQLSARQAIPLNFHFAAYAR